VLRFFSGTRSLAHNGASWRPNEQFSMSRAGNIGSLLLVALGIRLAAICRLPGQRSKPER
jgi:hypothetical protein